MLIDQSTTLWLTILTEIAKFGNFFLLDMARIVKFGKFKNKFNSPQMWVLFRMI